MRVTQKSFCKENNPCQNMLWQGLLVLKVGFWVSPILFYPFTMGGQRKAYAIYLLTVSRSSS